MWVCVIGFQVAAGWNGLYCAGQMAPLSILGELSETRSAGRLVLMTTSGATALTDFTFAADDILIMGRESAGVPESVHAAIADRVVIPLAAGTRSLNMAMAAGIAAHEALRQTGGFRGILSALK